MSLEGDEHEEDDTREEDKDDDDESDDRRHEMDEFDDQDDEEDSNRYQPLKRRASTGTLLNQAKASVVSLFLQRRYRHGSKYCMLMMTSANTCLSIGEACPRQHCPWSRRSKPSAL